MNSVPKIVVLEDDRASRALIAAILERENYQVLEASEGRYALELAMKERPVLLIADVMVPDMNGSEVVKKLLGTRYIREMKILFLTSLLGKSGPLNQATKLKVANKEFPALSKPFKKDVLVETVNRLAGEVIQAKEEETQRVKAAVEASAEAQSKAAEEAAEPNTEAETEAEEPASTTAESDS